ncbi:hypothetical protein L207DRAFT_522383 [Hyaloscypha variabilis F]|uniref:Alcohol dehydrogenase-like N-terminal domain-containing protein n=1 Tax=Hyaloscypha variabilis (strain UAMH 11265 / GT02V1 / F) TaxID=1149755 RepID=A0A2J6SE84_HYAVF|nr:hypothetical protein L207DRAFT_522383 [Hyaloscypha variabilis F]
MRAAILTRQGDPTVLSIRDDYPKPQISKNHGVLIRVKAIAINSADLMTRGGITAGPVIIPPKIIGSECIGVVEAISTELQRPKDQENEKRDGRHGAKYMVGDVVVALLGGMGRAFDGCYAAAHGILNTSLKIGPTDTLLVQGGSSAVGLAIACLAKNICGLKEVIGTTRSKEKVTRMEASGYSTVIILPRHQTEPPVPSELSEMIKRKGGHPWGFTAIVDLVGATNIPISLLCARRVGGSKVCMAGMLNGAYHVQQPFSPMSIPPGVLLTGYSSSVEEHLLPLPNLVNEVLASRIDCTPDRVFKFDEIVEAHKYCESEVVSDTSRCLQTTA